MTLILNETRPKNSGQRMVGARLAGYKSDADFYATPPEVTQALCDKEIFSGSIWEPACGDGAISKVLERNGYKTISTDLNDWGYGEPGRDFLAEMEPLAPNIVTNPPFNISEQFVAHTLSFAPVKAAFFLRLAWLEGQRRKQLFERHPPARVWVFSRRVPRMHRYGWEGKKTTSTIAFAWYVWDKNYVGETIVKWI